MKVEIKLTDSQVRGEINDRFYDDTEELVNVISEATSWCGRRDVLEGLMAHLKRHEFLTKEQLNDLFDNC